MSSVNEISSINQRWVREVGPAESRSVGNVAWLDVFLAAAAMGLRQVTRSSLLLLVRTESCSNFFFLLVFLPLVCFLCNSKKSTMTKPFAPLTLLTALLKADLP